MNLRGYIQLGVLALITLPLACYSANTSRKTMTMNDPVMTYSIGRFSISVPLSMKQAARTASLRHRELRETVWQAGIAPEAARKAIWEKRIAEIEILQPPEGKTKALIEERDMTEQSVFARAALYFGDKDGGDRVFCDLLTARNQSGLWIKSVGVQTKVEKMMEQNADIARAYKIVDPYYEPPKKDWFFLEHGAITLPYRSQEETYARFEGHPLAVKLELETRATHEVEEHGLIERTAVAIASGYAAGVNIERIRSRKRTLAGMVGEEEVDRMKSKDDSMLSFAWNYSGKKDSGDFPEIEITMETQDSQLDEKLKLWDALLNSFKPIGR